jgi:hypothetical protein
MLLAEDKRFWACSAASLSAALTMRWQSSKRPCHAQRTDVVAEAAELVCLPWRDRSIGIQDHHFVRRLLMKCGADRGTRIAGGGNQDRQRRASVRGAAGAGRRRGSVRRNP